MLNIYDGMENQEWIKRVENVLMECNEENPLHFFGYGNILRRDDGVGLHIISKLLKTVKDKPRYVYIHPALTNIEGELKKIPKSSKVIVIDAVKIDKAPGTIVFTEFKNVEGHISDTHNISLKFILEVNTLLENSYLLGIVPEDTEIGEELTPTVEKSAKQVITQLSNLLTSISVSKASRL